ncbi:MAG: 50S ribosomal protein L22 [Candidatus Nomurabacteria bacterium]|jgi:large subunit ribosomal protein L22|nr:50S ribosomal protein L22 [Candidatus Nomurabacteria bacterium]
MTDAKTSDQKIVRAYLKELRLAPRKVALVASLVRGRSVDDALMILSHTMRRPAKPLSKLIASARANAVNNHGYQSNGLQIKTLSVTAGSRLKRYRPVSRGMAHPFQKRTSNILVELTGQLKPVKSDKAEPAKATTVRRTSTRRGAAKTAKSAKSVVEK